MRAMAPPDEFFLDIQPALAHLRAATATLSASALSALSAIKRPDLTAFATTWVQLPVERRRNVAKRFVELSEENARLDFDALFRYFLNDQDPLVRATAIDGLWEDEDSALVKPLVGFLRGDPDVGVRVAAAEGLGRFVLLAEYDRLQPTLTNLTIDALMAVLRDLGEAVQVRARALEALGYSSRDGISGLLRAAYDSPEEEMRVSAIAGMGRSADSQWRDLLTAELDSPSARMRYEAVRALGELESRADVPRIARLLYDPDRQVQTAAISALGHIGGARAKQALTRFAESEDSVLSELAGDALEELAFNEDLDLPMFDYRAHADAAESLDDLAEAEPEEDAE